jgi:hypothetical protein
MMPTSPTASLRLALVLVLGALGASAPAAHAARVLDAPVAHASAVCADYPNQAAAQRAADTIDADGDGIYCESLPCPCLKPGAPAPPAPTPTAIPTPVPTATPTATPSPSPTPTDTGASGCQRPSGVQSISFSKTKYPNIRRHVQRAIRKGWPRVLVLNRPGADERRERLLAGWPTRRGQDRDEYPPAVGRGTGPGLTRGSHPRGWKADVAYVPSAENRSHGSVMGIKLRRFCDGTRFKYVFY